MKFKVKAWVGPCFVSQYAAMMARAGLKVVCEGTEHIHVEEEGMSPDGAAWNASVKWRAEHLNDGPRFIAMEATPCR